MKRIFIHYWWEWKWVQPLWRVIWQHLGKDSLTLCPQNSTPRYKYPEKTPTHVHKETYQNVHCQNDHFCDSKTQKWPKCPPSGKQINCSMIVHWVWKQGNEWSAITCTNMDDPQEHDIVKYRILTLIPMHIHSKQVYANQYYTLLRDSYQCVYVNIYTKRKRKHK